MEKLDLGNNETISRAIIEQRDGTFLVLTYSRSKSFKTARGAVNWWKKNCQDYAIPTITKQ